MNKAKTLLLNGKLYDCMPGETVLEALLRQKVSVPYSCMKQTCMSCMMQSLNCTPPIKSQLNLKKTLQLQNNFLACACIPVCDMEIVLNQEKLTTQVAATVVEINNLNTTMLELVLQCDMPVDFHGGQSALLLNYEHIGKRFPIASSSSAKATGRMDVHAEHIKGAAFSEWLHKNLKIGDKLSVCGVNGDMYYIPGLPAQPLLLAGWGGGLTSLIGIVQDMFEFEHSGPVYLFHSVAANENLYFESELREIGDYFPNFHYIPCVQQGTAPNGGYIGEIDKIIPKLLSDLSGWKVFLCGTRHQTHTVQRYAYLAGAGMKDIYLEVTTI
jgi:ferredoxin-NADP reductase/ferredoxin